MQPAYINLSCTVYTRKNAQVVIGLLPSANKLLLNVTQAVDKLCSHCLVPVVVTVWNKLLTTCNKLDGTIRLVTRLF
jgi:hypothetical protein